MYTHKKRAPRYTDLGRNTIKMGEHTSLMVVAASKCFDVVFLQERAVSEMIYLTNIKLVHYNGPEFLLNQTLRQHLLCQRCFLFQFICRTAMLAVHYLLVLLTPAKAPFKLLTRPWLSEPSLQTLNWEAALKSYETWWTLITPFGAVWNQEANSLSTKNSHQGQIYLQAAASRGCKTTSKTTHHDASVNPNRFMLSGEMLPMFLYTA